MANKIVDFLKDKELSDNLGKMKTSYKVLWIVLLGTFLLIGFALVNFEIGMFSAAFIAIIAYIPARLIFGAVMKNKGEEIYYPQYRSKDKK